MSTRSDTDLKSETLNPDVVNEETRLQILKKMKALTGDNIFEYAKIENYEWYFGMLSLHDLSNYMQQLGDFAVIASNTKKFTELLLSVLAKDSILHTTLICDKKSNEWTLDVKKIERKNFKSISDLINFYKTNPLPLLPQFGKIFLRNPCKRPKWILSRSAIKYGKLLGCGNFCQLFEGTLYGRPVAIKSCNPVDDTMKSEDQLNQEFVARENLIREGQIMRGIRHANIVKFHGICFDKPPVLIAMELCLGGTLLQHLIRMGNCITTGERLEYCIHVARGMEYLHKMELIHRDLAARNCLISKYGVVKIADFGLSKITSEVAPKLTTFNMQIPVRWMAPETLQRDQKFSKKSDMWSYGVLLFEVFSNGIKPWVMDDNKKIATNIRHGQMPDFPKRNTPAEIVTMTKRKIWQVDPERRPTFSSILKLLKLLFSIYPCPELDKLTINQIPGVKALEPSQIEKNEKIEEEEENIARDAMTSAIKRQAEAQINQEASDDDFIIPERPLCKLFPESKAKNRAVPSSPWP